MKSTAVDESLSSMNQQFCSRENQLLQMLQQNEKSTQVKRYFKRMPTEEYDEHVVQGYVDKFMATQCKEAHEQLPMTELLKPNLQNSDKYHMTIDMKKRWSCFILKH